MARWRCPLGKELAGLSHGLLHAKDEDAAYVLPRERTVRHLGRLRMVGGNHERAPSRKSDDDVLWVGSGGRVNRREGQVERVVGRPEVGEPVHEGLCDDRAIHRFGEGRVLAY